MEKVGSSSESDHPLVVGAVLHTSLSLGTCKSNLKSASFECIGLRQRSDNCAQTHRQTQKKNKNTILYINIRQCSFHRCAVDAKLPVVTLVLGGDGIKTIDQVKEALDMHRPVVIVKESSRVPTLLAELFYVLEDKIRRSLVTTIYVFSFHLV